MSVILNSASRLQVDAASGKAVFSNCILFVNDLGAWGIIHLANIRLMRPLTDSVYLEFKAKEFHGETCRSEVTGRSF